MSGFFQRMCEETGYELKTTFWKDFTIVEYFGYNAVRETYRNCRDAWKANYVYLTELVMILNWKIWAWYEIDETMAEMYQRFWKELDEYALDNLKGDELTYFLETID